MTLDRMHRNIERQCKSISKLFCSKTLPVNILLQNTGTIYRQSTFTNRIEKSRLMEQ